LIFECILFFFFFRKIQTEIENYCVATSHNGARASRRVGRQLKNDECVVDFNTFLKEEDQVKVDNLVQKLDNDGIPCLNNEQMYF